MKAWDQRRFDAALAHLQSAANLLSATETGDNPLASSFDSGRLAIETAISVLISTRKTLGRFATQKKHAEEIFGLAKTAADSLSAEGYKGSAQRIRDAVNKARRYVNQTDPEPVEATVENPV